MIKKMIEIWRRFFGKKYTKSDKTMKNETRQKTTQVPLLQRLENYLVSRYDFRFNMLTEQAEYRLKGESAYLPVDQRVLNTLCMEVQKARINCWDKDVSRLLCSQQIADYHPFHAYMESLPCWDGVDRVTELARRISDKEVWIKGFHRWMLGVTAQWMGMSLRCANSLAPILISTEQGRCKSTFCSLLMPKELQSFYIDKFDITNASGCEQKLATFGLINMDEFDRYSDKAMATLKNLMQIKKLSFRKSYRSYYNHLPRIASFIGTSNKRELLTDESGSRRFLCVEVDEKIDCTMPNHAQLYAQLKEELSAGEQYWFTQEEEAEIQANNSAYYKLRPEQEIFFRCFRLPETEDEGIKLSASEIFCRLQKKFPAALRGSNASCMGKTLLSLGVERIRNKQGSVYQVVPL